MVGIRRLHAVLRPWLCFSIYTHERSYDFIVPDGHDDEYTAQIFILALSALCRNATGALTSRRKYIVKRALMKIDESCKWKGTTRGQLLWAALEKTAQQSGLLFPSRRALRKRAAKSMPLQMNSKVFPSKHQYAA